MERTQLIEALAPSIQELFADTPENVRKGLERMSTVELEKMYQRMHERTTVPEGIRTQARHQAGNSPEAFENLRLKNELIQSQGWIIIFNTPVPQAKNLKLKDCEANISILTNWISAETTVITNPRAWLLSVFAENPSLVDGLVWEQPPISRQDKQALHARDWQTYIDFCRTSGRTSASAANFNVCVKILGSPLRYEELSTQIIELPNGPAVLTADGDTAELAPQSRAEQEQFRQERLQLDQATLKDMRDSGDLVGLYRRSRHDHEKTQPQFHAPAPTRRFTMEEIRTWDGPTMRKHMANPGDKAEVEAVIAEYNAKKVSQQN